MPFCYKLKIDNIALWMTRKSLQLTTINIVDIDNI